MDMGYRRPRNLVFGLLVLVAVWWSQGTSGSAATSPRVVRGQVSATGAASGAEGWRVSHPDTGVYRIRVSGSDGRVDVPGWSVAADVTVVPLGDDVAEIRFHAPEGPIDTDFEFVAAVER